MILSLYSCIIIIIIPIIIIMAVIEAKTILMVHLLYNIH